MKIMQQKYVIISENQNIQQHALKKTEQNIQKYNLTLFNSFR